MEEARIIQLPKIEDRRGNLTFIDGENLIPFSINRVYWIYDVPGGQVRGGHAFKLQQEFMVALSGSFDVVVHNGLNEQHFQLNRSYYGLYIPNGLWRHMENFSTNSVALILSSTFYDSEDYVRDFNILKKKN
jgi:dTDP-4-dehydrorhamnose 3,5-epimerase-like enzyme